MLQNDFNRNIEGGVVERYTHVSMTLCFDWQEYSDVGAVIREDLSEAELIIGVKSVPIDLLLPNKTYAFFSHTIKAQKDNMPLLDAILEKVKVHESHNFDIDSCWTILFPHLLHELRIFDKYVCISSIITSGYKSKGQSTILFVFGPKMGAKLCMNEYVYFPI